jgi:hypothetical protein
MALPTATEPLPDRKGRLLFADRQLHRPRLALIHPPGEIGELRQIRGRRSDGVLGDIDTYSHA